MIQWSILTETYPGLFRFLGGILDYGYQDPDSCFIECQTQGLMKETTKLPFLGIANGSICMCGLDWEEVGKNALFDDACKENSLTCWDNSEEICGIKDDTNRFAIQNEIVAYSTMNITSFYAKSKEWSRNDSSSNTFAQLHMTNDNPTHSDPFVLPKHMVICHQAVSTIL